jgi:hypothetical protein
MFSIIQKLEKRPLYADDMIGGQAFPLLESLQDEILLGMILLVAT